MVIYGVFIVGLMLFSYLLVNAEISESTQYQEDMIGELISHQTAGAASSMLVSGDRLSLNVLLSQLVRTSYILKASIYTIDDKRIAHAESSSILRSKEAGAIYSAPISYQDVIAGYVRLSINQNLLTKKPVEAIKAMVILSSLLLVSGLIVIFFYGENIGKRLLLIEQQLLLILPYPPQLIDALPKNEISRIAMMVEHQLKDKYKKDIEEEEKKFSEEVRAIVCVRSKNMERLKQLLAPRELIEIIGLQGKIVAEAAAIYGGELRYSPEGHGYIKFISANSDNFVMDALNCGFLIDTLCHRMKKNSIANMQIGLGCCLADQQSEQSESFHPALTNNVASQSLMLASLQDPDGMHMLRKQLIWLPQDVTDIRISQHGDDIVLISKLSESAAKEVEDRANDLEALWVK